MKIRELIEELQGLDQDADADAWIKAKANWSTEVLDWDSAGKAIRTLLPILGKPYTNYNHDQSGKKMTHRRVVWLASGEKSLAAANALKQKGITACKISPAYFTINIPYHAYFSSFTTSDDPVVWWRRNLRKWSAQIEADRLEHLEWLRKEEEGRTWSERWNSPEAVAERERQNAEYERQRQLEQARKEEEKRLLALGMEAQKAAEKAKEIKVEDLNTDREIIIGE